MFPEIWKQYIENKALVATSNKYPGSRGNFSNSCKQVLLISSETWIFSNKTLFELIKFKFST